MSIVTILFARKDSIYKMLPGCDVYDADRDALKWPGGNSLVAHPPCRAWGNLRHMAKPRPGEKELAVWSINQIRKWGGVLEHPKRSQLWPYMNLPIGTQRDKYGGFSLLVDQLWWGHRAQKATLLYVCGCEPKSLPPIPLSLEYAQYTISTDSKTNARRKKYNLPLMIEVKKCEREATPIAFAEWLIDLAKKCNGRNT